MKELSVEQKAKAYDDIIERLKDFQFEYRFSPFSDVIGDNFPELKESEDERIRKGIIRCIKGNMPDNDFRKKYIAWLEAQGAKVSAIEGFETEFERQVSGLIASAINKEHEYNQGYVKWTANALLNYAKHELEKQGEQKPAWSEEDETVLNNLIYALANDRIGNNRDEYVDWLKSLRPQPQWKPSDEQLFDLKGIAKQNEHNMLGKSLMSLYNDLLKLKG